MPETLPLKATLAGGQRVEIRAIRPADKDELRRAFERLSPESRLSRFLSPKSRLDDEQLRFLTEVDGKDHVAIVAVTDSPDLKSEYGLGVARFIRMPPGDVAEGAVTVVDAMQNRGLGTLLLRVLAGLAHDRGIRAFRAEVLADNTRIRNLLDAAGGHVVEDHGDTLVFEIPLEPVPDETERDRQHPLRRVLRAAAETIAALRPPER
ncbi:MAG TPA: GNAT family protein [Minicystis sp.]|nr:GNAT family protein [Minicystis sp.]